MKIDLFRTDRPSNVVSFDKEGMSGDKKKKVFAIETVFQSNQIADPFLHLLVME